MPRSARSKILSPQKLKNKMRLLRTKKKQGVFTNGCFDILHRGHVQYLEKAREEGDYLVVALNSDDSVRKLKGPNRPVNQLEDRLHILASLECVDYVTWFGEDTPLKLIELLQPQVLTKGADYKGKEVVGSRQIKSWGGKVKLIRFLQGRSTSSTLSKISKFSG